MPKPRRNPRALAVDPGTANVGLACVSQGVRGPRCVGLRYVATAKARAKVGATVADDDARRLLTILAALDQAIEAWDPDLVAVEWYAPRGGGQRTGWKTILTVGGIIALAWAWGLECRVQSPRDLRRFAGNAQTKDEVIAWAKGHVGGFGRAVAPIAPRHREHVADAVGHAALALARA